MISVIQMPIWRMIFVTLLSIWGLYGWAVKGYKSTNQVIAECELVGVSILINIIASWVLWHWLGYELELELPWLYYWWGLSCAISGLAGLLLYKSTTPKTKSKSNFWTNLLTLIALSLWGIAFFFVSFLLGVG